MGRGSCAGRSQISVAIYCYLLLFLRQLADASAGIGTRLICAYYCTVLHEKIEFLLTVLRLLSIAKLHLGCQTI